MTIGGLSEEEVLEEVLVVPRRAYPRVPDMVVHDQLDWFQIITPAFRNGTFNGVWFASLRPGEADARIDETIEQYRSAGLKFRWNVDPRSAPEDLGERLARRGLEMVELCGMVRATEPPPDEPALGYGDVTVERVTADTLADYSAVMAEGWGGDANDHAAFALTNAISFSDPQQRFPLYLARVRGEPAGAAGSVVSARSVYLMGGVVLPQFRRAGAYRGLVTARLADAATAGRSVATSHARATTSAPLLARLGFTEVARWRSYRG